MIRFVYMKKEDKWLLHFVCNEQRRLGIIEHEYSTIFLYDIHKNSNRIEKTTQCQIKIQQFKENL